MTAVAGPETGSQANDVDLDAKIFVVRNGRKLVRHLAFSKAAGQRPNSLRISVGPKHGTALTLKNKSFAAQYRRAIGVIAEFHGIAGDDPIRELMEQTASAFLAHYNLRTNTFTFERYGELQVIDDVAFPIGAEGNASVPATDQQAKFVPQAMLPDGLVRGLTFRPATSAEPAHIHVRRWRGKALILGLENVSFAMQYERAVTAMADSLGLAGDDPIRTLMHQSGQDFLQHYGLTTVPVTIPDVVVQQTE